MLQEKKTLSAASGWLKRQNKEREMTMKRTGFVYDERYLQHTTFDGHPECSERLVAIVDGLVEMGLMQHGPVAATGRVRAQPRHFS